MAWWEPWFGAPGLSSPKLKFEAKKVKGKAPIPKDMWNPPPPPPWPPPNPNPEKGLLVVGSDLWPWGRGGTLSLEHWQWWHGGHIRLRLFTSDLFCPCSPGHIMVSLCPYWSPLCRQGRFVCSVEFPATKINIFQFKLQSSGLVSIKPDVDTANRINDRTLRPQRPWLHRGKCCTEITNYVVHMFWQSLLVHFKRSVSLITLLIPLLARAVLALVVPVRGVGVCSRHLCGVSGLIWWGVERSLQW